MTGRNASPSTTAASISFHLAAGKGYLLGGLDNGELLSLSCTSPGLEELWNVLGLWLLAAYCFLSRGCPSCPHGPRRQIHVLGSRLEDGLKEECKATSKFLLNKGPGAATHHFGAKVIVTCQSLLRGRLDAVEHGASVAGCHDLSTTGTNGPHFNFT